LIDRAGVEDPRYVPITRRASLSLRLEAADLTPAAVLIPGKPVSCGNSTAEVAAQLGETITWVDGSGLSGYGSRSSGRTTRG
jgi:hypothetical protein